MRKEPGFSLPHAAFYMGAPAKVTIALPRELKLAAIISGAPQFPLAEIECDLELKFQGGLRGFVRDEELN